jgi:hypothetical protein
MLAYKYMEQNDDRNNTNIASDITLHFSSDCNVLVSLTYWVSSPDEHLFLNQAYEFMSLECSPIRLPVAIKSRRNATNFLPTLQPAKLQVTDKSKPQDVIVCCLFRGGGGETDKYIAVVQKLRK